MKHRDLNQTAYATLQQAIGAMPKEQDARKADATALGRKGGLKGGSARAKSLSSSARSAIAKKAAAARWGKKT